MSGSDLDFSSFSVLTRKIYAAVFDQARWQEFLEELTLVTGGVCTHLFGFDIPAGLSLGLTAAGYSSEFVDSYNSYYGAINSWAPGFSTGDPGIVLPSQWMCSKAELFQSEFYNDWVRPQEDVAAGGGAMIFKDETRMIAFGGNIRLKDEEKLEAQWLRTVGLLAPHLQKAFEISRILSSQSLELDLLGKRTINAGAAIMLLADNAFLLYANAAAEDLIGNSGVLRDDNFGRIRFDNPDAEAALERCLNRLRSGAASVSTEFTCAGNSEGTSFSCRMIRFEPEDHPMSPFPLLLGYLRAALLVTISPIERRGCDGTAFIAEHGLTGAEFEVATNIAEGFSPAELAEKRGVSVHTVRNQLKSAMHKLGAHRQTDLVRMIYSSRILL